jgi:surfactin synthase thioesterase subunit
MAAGLPEFEVCAVQLPGREDRFVEPVFRRMDHLVDKHDFTPPFEILTANVPRFRV